MMKLEVANLANSAAKTERNVTRRTIVVSILEQDVVERDSRTRVANVSFQPLYGLCPVCGRRLVLIRVRGDLAVKDEFIGPVIDV